MNMKLFFVAATSILASLSMAHEVIYAGTFSGTQEIPPNSSAGTGSCLVTIDLDTLMMTLHGDFTGLGGNTTASHIHVATAQGINGGVATQTPSFAGFPLGVTAGSYDHVYDLSLSSTYNPAFVTANGGTVSGAMNAFLLGLSEHRAYWNIHTSTFPGGEVRANLTAVPEPASMLVLGAGAIITAVRRRRKA